MGVIRDPQPFLGLLKAGCIHIGVGFQDVVAIKVALALVAQY